jgi:prevent-host-death family protein
MPLVLACTGYANSEDSTMRDQERSTQIMNIRQARDQFSQVVNRVHRKETRIIVEKSGIPVAAIVSADDLEQMRRMEAEREERFKALEATRQAFKNVPPEELEQEVERALAEVRAEDSAGPAPGQ